MVDSSLGRQHPDRDSRGLHRRTDLASKTEINRIVAIFRSINYDAELILHVLAHLERIGAEKNSLKCSVALAGQLPVRRRRALRHRDGRGEEEQLCPWPCSQKLPERKYRWSCANLKYVNQDH